MDSHATGVADGTAWLMAIAGLWGMQAASKQPDQVSCAVSPGPAAQGLLIAYGLL